MLLANYNPQELVTEQINIFLKNADLTFSDLKQLILSKAPIPEVQLIIVNILKQAKKSDQTEVKNALEKQACKKQVREDKKQAEHDQATAVKDERLKEHLRAKLDRIPTRLNILENELMRLQITLARCNKNAPEITSTHQHEHGAEATATTPEESKVAINTLKKKVEQQQIKIQALLSKKSMLQKRLKEIEERAKERLTLKCEREIREQARTGYEHSGEGLADTLSPESWSQLSKSIQSQYKALENKCSELIKETERIHYQCFLEQLPQHLNHLKRPEHEIEALKTLLKLIRKQIKTEHESILTKENLDKKKQLIRSQHNKLEKHKAKIKALHESNPQLTAMNEQLTRQVEELSPKWEYNNDLRQRWGWPSLLLLTLTCVFTIPLILTLNGIIPFFITPILLFTLVGAPPAILLLTTIAAGITTAVYAYKAHSNKSAMTLNKQTIENNNYQMGKNIQELQTLQTRTIPSLELQIQHEELIRDRQEDSLKKLQLLSRQLFKHASDIEPLLRSRTSFLNKQSRTTQEENEVSCYIEEYAVKGV